MHLLLGGAEERWMFAITMAGEGTAEVERISSVLRGIGRDRAPHGPRGVAMTEPVVEESLGELLARFPWDERLDGEEQTAPIPPDEP